MPTGLRLCSPLPCFATAAFSLWSQHCQPAVVSFAGSLLLFLACSSPVHGCCFVGGCGRFPRLSFVVLFSFFFLFFCLVLLSLSVMLAFNHWLSFVSVFFLFGLSDFCLFLLLLRRCYGLLCRPLFRSVLYLSFLHLWM